MATPEGLLLVDKPRGWTSHDVVAAVRGRLPRGVKVGHSGTLDPMATGLLVLLVGPATRLAAGLQGLGKVYHGRLRLGVETDSADLDGRLLRQAPVPSLDPARLQALFDAHVGELQLPPPLFSAVKVQGRPLYAYARAGLEVVALPRRQRVQSWRLLSWAAPEAEFRLACSSGTYVRSLAVALGQKLGCGAVVSELRRESVGSFSVADAIEADAAKREPLDLLLGRLLAPTLFAQ